MVRLDARRYRAILIASEAVKVVAVSAIAMSLAACSFSVIGIADEEPEVTGSIVTPKAVSSLSPDLNEEDWRRAKAALGVALDPQGPGTLVSWDNPQTALKGQFTPTGAPYVKNDEVCRDFAAQLSGSTQSALHGSACRPSGGDWAIIDVKPRKASTKT